MIGLHRNRYPWVVEINTSNALLQKSRATADWRGQIPYVIRIKEPKCGIELPTCDALNMRVLALFGEGKPLCHKGFGAQGGD
jgi:hypothetical protein